MVCRPVVNLDLCKGCGICVELCPRKALVLSDDLSPRGYRYPRIVGGCVGCRMCENFCPDFAIAVVCGEGGEEGSAQR